VLLFLALDQQLNCCLQVNPNDIRPDVVKHVFLQRWYIQLLQLLG
jgi:hypothetical protein